jgi:hypothetical protein
MRKLSLQMKAASAVAAIVLLILQDYFPDDFSSNWCRAPLSASPFSQGATTPVMLPVENSLAVLPKVPNKAKRGFSLVNEPSAFTEMAPDTGPLPSMIKVLRFICRHL